MKFLPTTKQELKQLGWDRLDIILVTGDCYIDSPYNGTAVIGRVLADAGYRVGIIAQPKVDSDTDITRLGEPRLFWGVSGGSVDSMVANYTATKKKRRTDDYTPGGKNDRRPDRAAIVYSNLIRRCFKKTVPIVLGGVEASLRRVAHYDYWSDGLRKSVLFDAKADYLIYGMGEKTIVELAESLAQGNAPIGIRGLCYIATDIPDDYLELPSYKEVTASKKTFAKMFKQFYQNNDPVTAVGLAQQQDTRYLVQNPPSETLAEAEMDRIHDLGYTGQVHPFYDRQGTVKAIETIRYSLMTHRGCYGECNFCSIAVHQGRTIQWRSEGSVLREARQMVEAPDFKGYMLDVGGPTANMYGFECAKKLSEGACLHKRCLYPKVCKDLKVDHSRQTKLLSQLRRIDGIKKVFVASGIRHDMVLSDRQHGLDYLKEVVGHHVSGQLKIAPEHTENSVLKKMGKPTAQSLDDFATLFKDLSKKAGKKQYLTYYLIAAHPGCNLEDMQALKEYTRKKLKIKPEQVQVFTPLPSTYSALMYYTGVDPITGKELFVEKDTLGKEAQKSAVTSGSVKSTELPKRTKSTKPRAKPNRPPSDPRRSARKPMRPRGKSKRRQ